jgi:hypothetical protein
MDTLNPDKTKSMYKYYCLMALIVILIGCNQNDKNSDKSQLLTEPSQNAVGEKEYRHVYSQVIDSINNWSANKLSAYRITNESWRIDSLLCFNQHADRFVTALQYQITSTSTDHDGIIFFYGIKIKDKWYFFTGASIHLTREMYQKNSHTPLSFAKLHEIAMKEVFGGYLIKKKKDVGFFKNIFSPEYEYVINDNFFKTMENREQDGTYLGFKTLEEAVLWQVQWNWKKR